MDLRDLAGLPEAQPMWPWQPGLHYHLIDKGPFGPGEPETREGLSALLFRLENSSEPDDLAVVADAVLAWFGRHPGFQAARKVLVEMLVAKMAPLGPGVPMPEELLKGRSMLATRARHTSSIAPQGEQWGEALLLVRLRAHRFGVLPG